MSSFVSRLQDLGVSCFFAAVDVQPGMNVVEWIDTSMANCTHLMLFWSAGAAASKYVRQEWQTRFWSYVDSNEKVLIPVRLDGTPLPPLLNTLAAIDASRKGEDVLPMMRTALMPRAEFVRGRAKALRKLAGHERAVVDTEQDVARYYAERGQAVETRVYEFRCSPGAEREMDTLLRSAGVALHESNQALTAEAGDLCQRKLSGPPDAFEYMEQITAAHGFRPVG